MPKGGLSRRYFEAIFPCYLTIRDDSLTYRGTPAKALLLRGLVRPSSTESNKRDVAAKIPIRLLQPRKLGDLATEVTSPLGPPFVGCNPRRSLIPGLALAFGCLIRFRYTPPFWLPAT